MTDLAIRHGEDRQQAMDRVAREVGIECLVEQNQALRKALAFIRDTEEVNGQVVPEFIRQYARSALATLEEK